MKFAVGDVVEAPTLRFLRRRGQGKILDASRGQYTIEWKDFKQTLDCKFIDSCFELVNNEL